MSPTRATLRAAAFASLILALTTMSASLTAADKATDSSKLPGAVKIDEYNDQSTGKESPVGGGSLTIRYESEPKILNEILDNSSVTQYIMSYVSGTMITRNAESFLMEPWVAEKWEMEDRLVRKDKTEVRGKVTETAEGFSVKPYDGEAVAVKKEDAQEVLRGTIMTFFLRKNVKWHDGKPLTARDVEFAFKVIKSPFLEQPHITNYYADLRSCEVLDDYTVRITNEKQYFLAIEMAGSGFYLLPRHVFDPEGKLTGDPTEEFMKAFREHPTHMRPIGFGPYMVDSWDKGSKVTLVRNPNFFWPEKAARIEKVVFRFITDDVASLQALKNGEIDFIPRMTTPQFYEQTNDEEFLKKFAKGKIYYPNYGYIGWNMRKSPFDDKAVRQAMNYCLLDREDFLKKVYHGDGVIVTGPQYYYGEAYDRSITSPAYDPKKADEMLMEAGWFDHDGDGLRDKDGVPFKFELLKYSAAADHPSNQMSAVMVENMKRMGIEMTVRQLEWPTYISNIEKLNFDACMLGWTMSIESDSYQSWHSSQTGEQGSNHVGFVNARGDELIMASRPELDDARRHQLAYDLQKLIYDEQPYFFLYCRPDYCAYRKNYRGVKLYRLRPGYDLTEWFIPKELQQ
ncbi:MAG: hypothetical protein HYY93_01065 [Planctomycetes bacterium]|nr:hypothetical protein [Planctomycetota bacterium]